MCTKRCVLEYWWDVTRQDFKIIVQPPLNNHRDFSCCPVIDGIKIQGFAGYGYGFPHRLSISDRLEVVSDGSIVRRSLRFKKLVCTPNIDTLTAAGMDRGRKARQVRLPR